jgi:hypothetical protein
MSAEGPADVRAARIATASTAAFVAIIAGLTLLALDRVVEGKVNDYYGYWDAARTILEGRPLSQAWGVVWLPLLSYVIVPLGLMGLLESAAVWTIANAAIAALLCHAAASAAVRVSRQAADVGTIPLVRLATLVAMLPPIRNVMYEGQFDLLLALLATVAIAGVAQGHRIVPAASVVAAAVVKWSSVALLPWMAIRRPMSAVAALAIAVPAVMLPALWIGWDTCLAQVRRALSGPVAITQPRLSMPDRWSLTNGLGRIAESAGMNPQMGRWIAIGLCACVALATVVVYWRRGVRCCGTVARGSRAAVSPSLLCAEGAAMMALPLVIHPHVTTRHATVMTFAAAILAAAIVARASPRSVRLATAGLGAMIMTWYMPYPMRGWWQWAGGPALAVLASAAIALWIQIPPRSAHPARERPSIGAHSARELDPQ